MNAVAGREEVYRVVMGFFGGCMAGFPILSLTPNLLLPSVFFSGGEPNRADRCPDLSDLWQWDGVKPDRDCSVSCTGSLENASKTRLRVINQ